MKTKRLTKLLLLLAAFALFAAACGGDDDDDATATAETEAPAATTEAMVEEEPMEEAMSMTPGDGVSVTMGRADWTTGYFQAELYRQLLTELGYTVSDPAELELGPNNGYVAMAAGDMDFWVNSWYPGHKAWLAGELPDGSLVGDHLTVLGEEMIAGGLQGFLVTKSFADEFGVYTLDALNSNADAIAAFDATDPVPGNGIADIFGCPESWTCDNIITAQIAFSGWENITQTIAGYDAMFVQAVDNANAGIPMVAYTWTPSAYITELRPGDNVYWIGVDNILDDSNPTGIEGGEQYDQTGDGTGGYAAIGADQCPAAADNADGLCPIGWIAADILATANNDFIDANPAAKALLEAVKLSVIEVSLANVDQEAGAAPGDLATAWIAENRATVDAWLEAARAAA
ncbi:glycine betaine ABC transporter substrate-binding protein [Candidatus Poriferisodalis sp.]|uniref:glycine betaine ABC transporter substrate-binding protein n=1 Tax=Candidatus Poriferisodalis sp. TaxID=3101277 RepID=UPI003B52EBDE